MLENWYLESKKLTAPKKSCFVHYSIAFDNSKCQKFQLKTKKFAMHWSFFYSVLHFLYLIGGKKLHSYFSFTGRFLFVLVVGHRFLNTYLSFSQRAKAIIAAHATNLNSLLSIVYYPYQDLILFLLKNRFPCFCHIKKVNRLTCDSSNSL